MRRVCYHPSCFREILRISSWPSVCHLSILNKGDESESRRIQHYFCLFQNHLYFHHYNAEAVTIILVNLNQFKQPKNTKTQRTVTKV